eukprot:COSAG04_NODE_17864_length_457_cov_0.717877_1_plen_105_part_10
MDDVQHASAWLFDTVLPQSPDRSWRTANCLQFSIDTDACPHRPASLRNLAATSMRRTDTHIVLPFAMLRTIMAEIPSYCVIGDRIVRPLKLPQGLHISSAGAVLN